MYYVCRFYMMKLQELYSVHYLHVPLAIESNLVGENLDLNILKNCVDDGFV